MRFLLSLLTLVALPFLAVSCASSTAEVNSNVDVKSLKRLHVEKVEGDGYDMDQVIAKDLRSRGLNATTGKQQGKVDAIVTYNDKWMWDMSMYLLQLDIRLLDPSNRAILASAKTYRPSLQRKSKEEMATETLDSLLATKVASN